ncbi:thiol peroxidase [Spiroplasma endosymbiont of Polydrusus pterygomalis]|uniref:thiol peroxidase n=1 Tax=Spiroplasma endosymbiont of Polydrusus pterygomalis TaxID=3139327 RepID=UPI003CCAF209
MLQLTIKGKPLHIKNEIIKVGDSLSFSAVDKAMNIINLKQFTNKFKIISSVPSIDTKTCALQTIHFNKAAAKLKDLVIITISKDLPFAQSRFCKKLKNNSNFYIWSDYRNNENNFSNTTNLVIDEIQLLARAVIIADKNNKVIYIQVIKEITAEPNYDEVLQFLKTLK